MVWKVDQNQQEIVNIAKKMGFSVQSLAKLGGGIPDLLLGRQGKNYLIEIKSGKYTTLTPKQEEWHKAWNGQKIIIRTPLDFYEWEKSISRPLSLGYPSYPTGHP
jgi:hypothetical protein